MFHNPIPSWLSKYHKQNYLVLVLHFECEKLMKASGKTQISDYLCFIFGNKMTYEKFNAHNPHLDLQPDPTRQSQKCFMIINFFWPWYEHDWDHLLSVKKVSSNAWVWHASPPSPQMLINTQKKKYVFSLIYERRSPM